MSNSPVRFFSALPPTASRPCGGVVHGLDWLRAFTAAAVLFFHATLAYTLSPWPGLAWPARDRNTSVLADAFCWWTDGFIMPVFFLIGGFISARMFCRQGAEHFLKQRSRRLGAAFLFAMTVLMPPMFFLWLLTWAILGEIPYSTLWTMDIPDRVEGDLWGVGHLWFLEYLWLFSAGVWLSNRLLRGRNNRWLTGTLIRLHRFRDRVLGWFALPFLLAVPAAAVLYWEPRVVIGFRHGWIPQFANVLYFAPWFIVGFWMQRHHRRGADLTRWCRLRTALAFVAFGFAVPYLQRHAASELVGVDRALMAGLFALYAWLAATGLVGLCLRYLNRPTPPAVSYLAEASLWIYLCHVPLVGGMHLLLFWVDVPSTLKWLLSGCGALAVALLEYEFLVRRTWIGRLLNGGRPASRQLRQSSAAATGNLASAVAVDAA